MESLGDLDAKVTIDVRKLRDELKKAYDQGRKDEKASSGPFDDMFNMFK